MNTSTVGRGVVGVRKGKGLPSIVVTDRAGSRSPKLPAGCSVMAGADAGAGTDFLAVENGLVSVTPLSIDLTRHAALPDVERWLGSL